MLTSFILPGLRNDDSWGHDTARIMKKLTDHKGTNFKAWLATIDPC